MSKLYVVKVKEVYTSHVAIRASNEQEALEKWFDGDEIRLEYSYTDESLDREIIEFNLDDYTGEEVSRIIETE